MLQVLTHFTRTQHWEFQWYSEDSENSFVENGKLHVRPTLTIDKIGENNLYHGRAVANG